MSDYDVTDVQPLSPSKPKVNKFPLPHMAKRIVEQDQAQEQRSLDLISLKH